MFCLVLAGVHDHHKGAEPAARTTAGEGGGDHGAEGGAQQHTGEWRGQAQEFTVQTKEEFRVQIEEFRVQMEEFRV